MSSRYSIDYECLNISRLGIWDSWSRIREKGGGGGGCVRGMLEHVVEVIVMAIIVLLVTDSNSNSNSNYYM